MILTITPIVISGARVAVVDIVLDYAEERDSINIPLNYS